MLIFYVFRRCGLCVSASNEIRGLQFRCLSYILLLLTAYMVQPEDVQLNGEDVREKAVPEVSADTELLREMTLAGLFVGRKKSKTHPRMRPFIFATRNGVEIINLAQTAEALDRVSDFLAGKQILVVGTQPAAQDAVQEFAKKFNFPYVTQRWLGGTLTNFNAIQKRMDYFKKLKENMVSGALYKYTKKEQLEFQRELERLEVLFGGLLPMTKMPDVLLAIGMNQHLIAIREAKKVGIPVIAVANTDANPDLVDYCIPANDIAKSSVLWLMNRFSAAVEKGKLASVAREEAAV